MHQKIVCPLVVLLAFILFLPTMASAQQTGPKGPPFYRFSFSTDYTGAADIEDGPSDVAITSLDANIGIWKFDLGYKRDMYSWGEKSRIPFGNGTDDPWSELQTLSLSAHHGGRINDKWGYYLRAGIANQFETEFGPIAGFVMASASYKINDNTRARFGFAASYHEVESTIRPVIGIDYNPGGRGSDGSGWYVSIGFPRTNVGYKFNEMVGVRASVLAENGLFRLADDSTVSKEGFVSRSGYGSGLFVDVTPNENIEISAGAYYLFNREMEIYDKDDNSLGSYDVDNALAGHLSLKLRF